MRVFLSIQLWIFIIGSMGISLDAGQYVEEIERCGWGLLNNGSIRSLEYNYILERFAQLEADLESDPSILNRDRSLCKLIDDIENIYECDEISILEELWNRVSDYIEKRSRVIRLSRPSERVSEIERRQESFYKRFQDDVFEREQPYSYELSLPFAFNDQEMV